MADELMLTDEETFNLAFKTHYTFMSPELGAYGRGLQDGSKAQLDKAEPIIRKQERATTLREVLDDIEGILQDSSDLQDFERQVIGYFGMISASLGEVKE